jgi:putative ABC transport system ATP-binding protein
LVAFDSSDTVGTTAPLIRVENLARTFVMGSQEIHALDGVSTTIHKGEMVALLGPSGSGKSTFLYLVGGLDRPSAGTIWIDDREITALDEPLLAQYRQHTIGFVFQSFHLVPTMTALQNVTFPMIFARIPSDQRKERAESLLATVGLGDRMDHRPTELSGGQQQRVAIARALANDPDVILADEPTGNLDTQTGATIVALLQTLCEVHGKTILVVSHDPAVEDYVTRTLHMRDGRLIDGSDENRTYA